MCPNCNMQVVQTIGHATVWPKFKDARMVAHDDAWEAVASVLQQLVGPESAWQFQWGTAVSSGPCCTLLRPVIQHLPAPTPPKRWIIEELARLRPDGLAVNTAQRSIVILEFCRPLDNRPGQLRAAFDRKDVKVPSPGGGPAASWLVSISGSPGGGRLGTGCHGGGLLGRRRPRPPCIDHPP